MSDNQPCKVSFDEQRRRAFAEFEEGYKHYPADAAWALDRQLQRITAAEEEEHERLRLEAAKDNDAVGRLAHAMRAKLEATRQTRGGWWTKGCTNAQLATMLRVCVEKGDPVDVANLCAFLHARGERIPSASRPAAEAVTKDVPVKALDGLDAQYMQALSDPNADSEYLRGSNNGIICAHATIFGHEPFYIDPQPYKADEVAKAEPSADTRTDYIGRLVPRSVPEDAPRNDTADALAYALGEGRTEPQGWMAAPSRGAGEFAVELRKARQTLPTMASAHEGLALIAEEFDELKALVWQKQSERDYAAMRKETIQLGAMVLAFLREIVEPENRR